MGLVGILALLFTYPVTVKGIDHGPRKAGLAFSNAEISRNEALGLGLDAWINRKRKRKKRTLAIGVVVGNPAGLGGRAILRIKNVGLAGDIAYNRIRSDSGPLVNSVVTKLDARFYRRGLLGKLLRVYGFGGVTMQNGKWDGVNNQSALQIDAGIGGGIKLWQLSINGEIGLLIPAVKPTNYDPGFGVFANIAVMLWLL